MAGNHLSELLTSLREDSQYSMRKMARVCGVSRESIRKYETGSAIPSNQTLKLIFSNLGINPEESKTARLILISVYQARRERKTSDVRSFGPAAQLEIEGLIDKTESTEVRADKLLSLFFQAVGPERRTDSFEFFLKSKITEILNT